MWFICFFTWHFSFLHWNIARRLEVTMMLHENQSSTGTIDWLHYMKYVHLCAPGVSQKHWAARKNVRKGVSHGEGGDVCCRSRPGDCYWHLRAASCLTDWYLTRVCGICLAASRPQLNWDKQVWKVLERHKRNTVRYVDHYHASINYLDLFLFPP